MIEKLADLGLEKNDKIEQWEAKIQEKLGITIASMRELLSNYVQEHARTLVDDFMNMAPLGDYSKLIEEPERMVEFLKTEAHKPEHWKWFGVQESEVSSNLLSFEFGNSAIDDGDICTGFVYVSFQGKVKHVFAQGDV